LILHKKRQSVPAKAIWGTILQTIDRFISNMNVDTHEQSLAKFREMYNSEFGEELNEDDLERKARLVLALYSSVYRSLVEIVREETTSNQTQNE
jgi:hypothetical protein